MESFTLTRINSSDNGTIGKLTNNADQSRVCYTCELPWKNNQNQISCIPHGVYTVTKFKSPSKGDVFLVHDVPHRDMIEIHAGNTMHDVLGCICVGDGTGTIKELPAVLNSKMTLAKMLDTMPDSFTMEVTGVV